MHTAKIDKAVFSMYMLVVAVLCFINPKAGTTTAQLIHYFNSATAFPGNMQGDKLVHFLMFVPFPLLAVRTWGRQATDFLSFLRLLAGTFLAGILTGGAIECLQGLSGYRSCDLHDFEADCAGLLLGVVMAVALFATRHKNNPVIQL